MPRTRLPAAAPPAFLAFFALFVASCSAAFAAPPAIVFDTNDNPIPPATAAPRAASGSAADPFPFDANDNPLPSPAALPSLPTRRVSPTSLARRVFSAFPPAVAEKSDAEVTVRASPNPLKASATALCRVGDRLYLGLRDGGVAFCDAADGGHGGVVRFVAPTASPVRAITAEKGVIWWTGDGATVYRFQQSDQKVTSYYVGEPAAGWVQRLALLDGTLALCGDRATRVLDPITGALRPPTPNDGFPGDALLPDGGESLYIAGGDTATVATVVGGTSPRVWRAANSPGRARRGGRDWREVTAPTTETVSLSSDAPVLTRLRRGSTRPSVPLRLDVDGGGWAAVADVTGLHLLAGEGDADAGFVADIPFGREPGMPTTLDRFAVGASGAWWLMRGTLFHATPDGANREAYLPWNSAKGAQVQALLPDANGVFVALDRGGVRHLTPNAPSATDGYAGYVLARLGEETCQPAPGPESDVAQTIEEWQGVPYLWGGQTKHGTDCSGFVGAMHKAVGVAIPRSTAEMTASRQGGRILDELRYGDVLVYPGHCALYIGNGHTAETVSSQVSKASIWRRTEVVVKRYLP